MRTAFRKSARRVLTFTGVVALAAVAGRWSAGPSPLAAQEPPRAQAPGPEAQISPPQAQISPPQAQISPPQAQGAPQQPGLGVGEARSAQSISTLEVLRDSIEAKREELTEKEREIAAAPSGERRDELLANAKELQDELERLSADFESVATGIDLAAFNLGRGKDFDLKTELERLVSPIIEELKSLTESPRQIEELRTQLTYHEERQTLAQQAIQSIDRLLLSETSEELNQKLRESKAAWQRRLRDIQSQASVARYQLETRLERRTGILQSVKRAVAEFFRTRGLNLLLAIGTFATVFVGLRYLYRAVRRLSPIHRRAERPFYARLLDVLYHGFTGLAALLASLIVLYAAGDWVLLGIALLFLLGLAWASKATLPQFFEQIRILLNLGNVRELERVVYNGLPWRVSRLSFYAILSNPELAGGIVRLPVKQLTEMRSRPVATDDVWFPSHRGDWVRLSDGRVGQIVHQSPEAVKLRTLGNSSIVYPTLDYLGMNPENLMGGFTVGLTFGIDYAHQPICTTVVPKIMRERLETGLLAIVKAEELTRLTVEFQSAGASSLDYAVFAGFPGSLADRIRALERAMHRILVDTCNEEGWIIPFMQVTVHEAAAAEETADETAAP